MAIGDVGRERECLQLVICCRARDNSVGLALGEQKQEKVYSLPVFLLGMT